MSSQVLSAIWYSRFLLGNIWLRASFPAHKQEIISHKYATAYATNELATRHISVSVSMLNSSTWKASPRSPLSVETAAADDAGLGGS